MRIASKLVLFISLSISIMMGIVSWFIIQEIEKAFYTEIHRQLTSNLQLVANGIDEKTQEAKRTSEIIASNPAFSRALSLDIGIGINAILNRIPAVYPFYNYIMIVTLDGHVLAVNTKDRNGNNIAGEELLGVNVMGISPFSQMPATTGPIYGAAGPDPFLSLLGIDEKKSQWFVSPVFKGPSQIGWVVLSYDWQGELTAQLTYLRDLLRSLNNPVLQVAVYDEKGNVVISSEAPLEKIVPSPDQLWQEKGLLFGKGEMKLVIVSNRTKIIESITRIRSLLVAVISVTTIVLVCLLYLIVQRTLLARLKTIKEGAIELKSGNLTYRLPPLGRDELGQLASMFNEMGESLQDASKDLESKVKDRTIELRESEGFLRQSEKIGRIGGWKANPFTDSLKWTQGVYDILGISEDHIMGLDRGLEFYTPPYRLVIKEAIVKTIEQGEPFMVEAEVITATGDHIWTEVRGLMRVEEGEGPHVVGSFQDITERKLADEAIRETHKNFRAFFETMDDIIIVGQPDGKIIYCNPTTPLKLGYTSDELMAMHVLDLHPVEKRLEAERIFEEMFKGERDVCPLPLATKDGIYLPVETRVWFGKWSGKDCIFGISKDLSREQAALRKFDKFFRSNPVPMAVSSFPDNKFTDVNQAFVSTSGFSEEEVIGKTSLELGLLADVEIRNKIVQALRDDGRVRDVELKLYKKDGGISEGLFFGEVMENQGHKSLLSAIVDITERRRFEKDLAENQAILRGLLDSIPDIVFFKDVNGVYLGSNHQFSLLLGCDEKEIVGRNDYDLFDRDVADFFREQDRLMMRQGSARRNEEWIEYPDGRRILVDTFKAPLRSLSGEVIGLLGVARDITERKRIEEALMLSEQRFRLMFENHGAIMLLIEPVSGAIIGANRAAERFYGYDLSQLSSMSIKDINTLHPEEVEREYNLAIQERRNYFVFPHQLSSGEIRTVEVHSSPVEQNGHQILFSIVHDITDRKLAESRLAEVSELNQQIIDNSPVGICIYEAGGRCIIANDSAAKTVGTAKGQLLTLNFRELQSWQEAGLTDVAIETLNTGILSSTNAHMVTTFGKQLWISCLFNRFYLRGQPHLLAVFSDVTDLKKAEEKLIESNERLEERVAERSAELLATNRSLLVEIQEHADTASALSDSEKSVRLIIESSPVGIIVINDGKYSFVNEAFIKITGLADSSEFIGKLPEAPFNGDSGKQISDLVRRCIEKSETLNVNELRIVTRNKRERHLNIWLQPAQFWGSHAVIGFMIDVSEELELRSHLNQSQKMEALGSLAGGIAHDFNNILFAITGYTELALGSASAGSKLAGSLNQVLRAAERAGDLVKHILTFSREREQEKQPLLISPIVKEALNFLRASITQSIEMRKNINSGLHAVNADPTQIHQIIMNLATNAAHAMKDSGGILTVDLDEVYLSTESLRTRPGIVPGTYQRLKVSDTGHGMPQEILERIFDPYFTTKAKGEGTGLGLSVIDSIVRGYGGTINVESSPGEGTTFEIFLPIIMEKQELSDKTDQNAPVGQGRILFVDDEAIITSPCKSNLERLGYKVTTENDPVRALSRFADSPDMFDLVITDMSMPNMTGLQLSLEISRIRWDIPIILISGYTNLLEHTNVSDYGVRELIYKPLTKTALAQAVFRALIEHEI